MRENTWPSSLPLALLPSLYELRRTSFGAVPGEPGTNDTLFHFVDLFPTLISICGLSFEVANPLDGISFNDPLQCNGSKVDKPKFWRWNRGQPSYTHNAAVSLGNWKLVRPYITRADKPEDFKKDPRLYCLGTDREESVDLRWQNLQGYDSMQELPDI